MNVLKEFRNDLLKRKEVKIVVNDTSNPGIEKSRKLIAEKFKADENCIAVKTLKSKFGRDTFLIDAFVYDNIEAMKMIEPKKKEKKAGTPGAA